MTHIRLTDLTNGYVNVVQWLIETGSRVVTRELAVREQTGVTLVVDDVEAAVLLPVGVNRRINTKLAAVETLQLLSGMFDVEQIRRAAPSYAEVMVDPTTAEYSAYGVRTRYQLDDLYHELRSNPTSRRAVVAIWHQGDLTYPGDRPCTLSLQFMIRDDKLELHATMRSQDAWLGLPYDAFMFSQLQLSLARQLGVVAGKYVHHVGSLHLYERNLEDAAKLTKHAVNLDGLVADAYPRGVVALSDEDFFTEVAAYLLDNSATVDEYRANQWYADQLAKIGLTGTGGAEAASS